jgi:hypothetical protein
VFVMRLILAMVVVLAILTVLRHFLGQRKGKR